METESGESGPGAEPYTPGKAAENGDSTGAAAEPAAETVTWRRIQEERATILHRHIAGYQQLIGADRLHILQEACAPYYRMLEEIYREDMPLADTLDGADLVARMEGPAVSSHALPLALVTTLLGDMQAQLGVMVRTIASGLAPGLEWPRDLEFGLSSFARGSLYLGFELPQPPVGTAFIRGDPLVEAARQSLHVLGAASRLAANDAAFADVQSALPDPHIRDAALAAVERLSPNGRRGIESLSLTGRCFGDQAWRRLTPDTRLRARAWMERPSAERKAVILKGVVRQVDLDQRRFDLRLDAAPDAAALESPSGARRRSRKTIAPGTAPGQGTQGVLVRCRFSAGMDREAKGWLGRTVEVNGEAELYEGRPRLVYAQSVKIVIARDGKAD